MLVIEFPLIVKSINSKNGSTNTVKRFKLEFLQLNFELKLYFFNSCFLFFRIYLDNYICLNKIAYKCVIAYDVDNLYLLFFNDFEYTDIVATHK